MILTSLQNDKVNEIVYHFSKNVKEVQFKSPTGSGKTLMASSVISKIINDHPSDDFVFVIATISHSELPKSFEKKINEYKQDLITSDFEVEYIESPSNNQNNKSDRVPQIKLIRNKVYIFGKATFGSGRIFTEQEVFSDFIHECKSQKFKVIYIRDEAHIGTKNQRQDAGVKTFEKLMTEKADFILKMTATLEYKSGIKTVELKEKDLCDINKNENKWLIKNNPIKLDDNTISDELLLSKAIEEFQNIQKEYKKLDHLIRPALLIQVDNEPTDKEKKIHFEQAIQQIKTKLSSKNLSWVQYFGENDKDFNTADNKSFSLNKITRNNDTTDCIIFKIGPATGWDIPRACMLLQLRNVSSANLNIQTIGRIKRNPYPQLIKNEITDKYFIFTNAPKDKNNEYTIYDYQIKEKHLSENFAVIKAVKDEKEVFDLEKMKQEVSLFLKNKENEIKIQVSECFTGSIYCEKDKKLVIKNALFLVKRIHILSEKLTERHKQIIDEIRNQTHTTFKWEQLHIILLAYFQKEINTILHRCMPISVKYKLEFEALNPTVYTEILDVNNQSKINIEKSSYLFDIKENSSISHIQPLDSEKEYNVGEVIKSFVKESSSNVKVWYKNQTTSNIYGEYINEAFETRKSYFDYIVKFNNGNYLYLEVKGDQESDIDINKTQLLQDSYKDYFSKTLEKELFKNKIVIAVVKVGKHKITPFSFYDEKKIKTDLNGKSLKELLIYLAD